MEKWKLLLQIFWTFFKISPVTFGGGFAMIPLIEKEIVEKRKWLDSEDVTEIFALSQTVPGAVAINSASFIGYRVSGIKGAIAALIGVSLPTSTIVFILGIFFFLLKENPKVAAAFMAIRASIVAIIIYAAIKTVKTAIVDKFTFWIVLLGVPLLFFLHPILVVIIGAITGIVTVYLKKKLGQSVQLDKKHEPEEDYRNNPDYFMGAGI